MHQLSQAHHEHWSRQGVLEHFSADAQKLGVSNEGKSVADPFSKLLTSFEVQEHLPTLHPISVLTPSKRQRKSCRPLRVPPVCEIGLPRRDKQVQSEGARMEQSGLTGKQPPVSLQSYDTATISDMQQSKKLKSSSPIIENLHCMADVLQNGTNVHDVSPPIASMNPENFVISAQKFDWNSKNLVNHKTSCTFTQDKVLDGFENKGLESFTSLLTLQQNDQHFDSLNSTVCRNIACQTQIPWEASFCKRCSCCICKLFDDKRDPSLWILCDPITNSGCKLSCHLECALKQGVAGVVITANGRIPPLDGAYFCQSCGAVTPLIRCWKEQLLAAKGARTWDSFMYRLLLSYRLLKGTSLHRDAYNCIDEIVKKVDAEVSQLAKGSLQQLQPSVSMLSCKEEVLRLINLALQKADTPCLASTPNMKQAGCSIAPCMVCFEDVGSSSIVVTVNDLEASMRPKLLGYKLWHRRASEPMYACTPTCILHNIHDKFVVSNLHPLTDYTFKVVPFSREGDLAVCEAGCTTKGAEPMEAPLDVYAALDVVLINTKLVGDGTSRSMNQVFNLDYHIDKPKNGLKIQDWEEALPDQSKQGYHVSSVTPSTRMEQKDNCGCFEGMCSPFPQIEVTARHGSGEHVHRDIVAAEQDRSFCSLVASGPSKLKQSSARSGNPSVRKSPSLSLSLDCQEDRCLTESCCRSSGLKPTNGFCSSTEKASTTKALKCDRPSQGWHMHTNSSNNVSAASTQATMRLGQRPHDYIDRAVTRNGEIDFSSYEFSVKVIRWLECQGYLKEEFRMKFLTWYTLRATEHEKRVVSVFIDTLQDDPESLGGQLVDAFEDIIESKRQSMTPDGGHCRRLW